MSLVVTHALDFGKIFASSTNTVAPNAAKGGRFEVNGETASSITVTLTMPISLTPTVGTSMAVSGWNYMVSTSSSLSGATAVPFSGGTAAVATATFTGGATKIYFAVGATATASASQAIGTYTGTGQITAAYSDL